MNVKDLDAVSVVTLRDVPLGELARALYRAMSGSWWSRLDDEPTHVQESYIREARRFVEILKDYASQS